MQREKVIRKEGILLVQATKIGLEKRQHVQRKGDQESPMSQKGKVQEEKTDDQIQMRGIFIRPKRQAFSRPPYNLSILSWNGRGSGNPNVFRVLSNLVRKVNLFCMFLMETKSNKARMEKVGKQLGFHCTKVVEAKGIIGGLAFS